MLRTVTLLTLLSACAGSGASLTDATDDTGIEDTDPEPWVRPEGGDLVVEMVDGVRVPSRYEPASAQGRPAVILLHGGRAEFSRHDWPEGIIRDLVSRDYTVLVPDVRGCGEAEGKVGDLATLKGVSDLRQYMQVVHADGYGKTIVVAGNGVDGTMTAYAARDDTGQEDLPLFAMGYLTSHVPRVVEGLATLRTDSERPVLFQFETGIGDWARSKRQLGNPAWTFIEYPERGGLDLTLFAEWANPQAADDLVAWIDDVLDEG